MTKQKYPAGTRVWIQDDLGGTMSHFSNGVWAVVLYTHGAAYHTDDSKSYALEVEERGFSAWYDEHQLHLEKPSDKDRAVAIVARETRRYAKNIKMQRYNYSLQSLFLPKRGERGLPNNYTNLVEDFKKWKEELDD